MQTPLQDAVVVMSGGQDSVTCLGIALHDCHRVTAVTFAYGQKHAAEIDAARRICDKHYVQHMVVDLSGILGFMRSSALITGGDVNADHPLNSELPASFVPARNALFLTAAYGIALEVGAKRVYTGVCQTDYSGYPDCREEFVSALNIALNLGYGGDVQIVTPLMHLDKAATFALANSYGFLDTVLQESLTCYNGVTLSNEWGMGCGECPACKLRLKGWEEYKSRYQPDAQ
jgi:7-cyano-7-deazaguanine synthase